MKSCAEIDCGGIDAGNCVEEANGASCACKDGYVQVVNAGKPTCVPETAPVDPDPGDVCKNVTCSGHGKCSISDGEATCECDEGFENSGDLECTAVSGSTLCADKNVDCGGHGRCLDQDDKALCLCDDGYHSVETSDSNIFTCEADAPQATCDGIDCDAHGKCAIRNDKPVCDCDSGYQNEGDTHCKKQGNDSGGHANGGEVKDAWGLIWDKEDRKAATHEKATEDCKKDGGRLPTPTEIYRIAGESGGVWTGKETNKIWTSYNYLNDMMEAVYPADGSLEETLRTKAVTYRCVWDSQPKPITFTGTNCNGDSPDNACLNIKVNKVNYTIDAKDRMPQHWFQAAEECRAVGGRLPKMTELNDLIWAGAENGSDEYLWTWDAAYASEMFAPIVVRWNDVQDTSYAITGKSVTHTSEYNNKAIAWYNATASKSLARFRCISEPVSLTDGKPKFPQPKTEQAFQVDPLLYIDPRPRDANSYWEASWDCMANNGGKLASVDEVTAAIRKGLVSTTTSWILTSSLSGAKTVLVRWDTDFIVPYWNLKDNIKVIAISASNKYPYFCAYRPNREWNKDVLNDLENLAESGEVFKNDNIITHYVMNKAGDSTGPNLFKDSQTSTYRGMMLPTNEELLYVIRRALPGGSNAYIRTSSVLSSGTSMQSNTIRWKGDGSLTYNPLSNTNTKGQAWSVKMGYRSYISSIIR